MFDLTYKRGCRKVKGVRVFTYSIALPDLKDYPKIAGFYEDISSLVVTRCEGELSERAESEYLSLEEKDRQTVFRPTVYSLFGDVTYHDSEVMIIKLTATLKKPLEKQSKTVFEIHAWSLYDQILLPPRYVARRFIPKGRLPLMLGDCGFLVEDGKYYLCRRGSLFELKAEKRKFKNFSKNKN